MKIILFPSSYFDIKIVDENFQDEYNAVSKMKEFDIVLFSYDEFLSDRKLRLSKSIKEKSTAVYRGWMMKPEWYKDFYDKLYSKNICLITNPTEYEKMHIFPNVYPELEEDTAKMLIFKDIHQINPSDIREQFQKFMIKDFVKSVKGTDFPKYFDADISETELKKWIEVFLEYRGNLLTGGICVKEFLPLKFYGSKPNEYRVFYMRNTAVCVSRNSGQPLYTPQVPNDMTEKYSSLSSPFYTVDFAELEDSSWKIIETGDGQVSGLSDNQNTEAFYRALCLLMD